MFFQWKLPFLIEIQAVYQLDWPFFLFFFNDNISTLNYKGWKKGWQKHQVLKLQTRYLVFFDARKNPGWSPSVITILDTPGSFGVRVLLASCPNHSEERIFPPERQYLATLLASRTAPQHSLPCSQTNNLAPQTQDRTFWSHEGKGLLFPCAHDWNRTSDLSLFRRMLFQLSYEGF